MSWVQKEIYINDKPRGFHLITDEILKNFTEINQFNKGMLHIFILLMKVLIRQCA